MASVSLFVFFLVSYLGLLLSAGQEESSYTQNCRRLLCGDLEKIGFPFIDITDPKCYVGIVNCNEETHQTIQLGTGERQYELTSIGRIPKQPNAYVLGIRDQKLSENLTSGRCKFITNPTILPRFPFISLQIKSHNRTFVKCDKAVKKFGWMQSSDIKCEDGYYLYDGHPSDGFPPGCSPIQLPIKPRPSESEPYPVEFELLVNVSDDCSPCHEKEGQCQIDRNIYCPKKGKKSKVLAIALGVGCPAIVIIIICLWRSYKKKNASTNSLARNTYAVQSSRSDLEGGSVYFGVHIFPYSELQEATNNFDDEKELGDGGFGTVYYGKLHDGREVAVKRLYEHNCRQVQQFINEVEILMRMRHKNLVSLYGCTSRRSRELLLVYEYIPNGTVADHIHGDRATPGSLPWPTRMGIAIETASALAYLHASEIIHRDVKTNNILLDNNFCVKVADFGLSRLFPNDVTHVSTRPQGTPGYVDPEYRQCYQLTKKSDVYSFGVVLIELISSLPAVDITRHRHEINLANLAVNKIEQRAFHELIDPHLGFQSDDEVKRMTISVASVAFQCTQGGQELRPSMVEVLEALKGIQSGKDAGPLNVHPPTSPGCDEVGLLKKTHELRPSPNDVTDKWTSRSSTPNISG
ncbi:LEAF RUST 10 DISEASE-RESISTANCE LOCUS RECEPTOR-LIKE PROTEIN KINASE-like 1.1 isoform X1 [Carya illinoinensis]|uniref:non-specific serine/threonine protein kinase n=1 Tax=Carya illinoinensis TaxID=32201 RepID=A0A8T1Q4Y9_CARIL|nr:LEAF RUST 10 DISEASE-RESISTANCE LOCUS RECEPTOR-LIKE PROTEIN KINASE-like 1.1 isoform X1 [Carya illinoinensis]KAG6650058.1 hypothetical protein CIPAW_06G017100 [Carya illinoinensis]